MPSRCPSPKDLINFTFGEGVDADPDELAAHLDTCDDCRTAIEKLELLFDPLLVHLRQSPDAEDRAFLGEQGLSAARRTLDELPIGSSVDHEVVEREPMLREPPFQQSLEVGRRIDDFHILTKLGSGGMSVVYYARQISENRNVALKVLAPTMTRSGELGRFQREAAVIARLDHRGIPSIYKAWQMDNRCYIAMDYVHGVTLQELAERIAVMRSSLCTFDDLLQQPVGRLEMSKKVLFDRAGGLKHDECSDEVLECAEHGAEGSLAEEAIRFISTPAYIRRVCKIIRDSAMVLHHAHTHDVIHRDVKPSNVMLDGNDVFVIDFGLSRLVDDISLTHEGQLVGTPMYMSPEQLTLAVNVDHRADIYGLGMTLYEMLTLTSPIQAESREAVLRCVVSKPLVPVSWRNGNVPRDLEGIVHTATAKDADLRYQTASDLAKDLDRFLNGEAVDAAPYRYQFSEAEITARRPRILSIVSLWFFYSAMLYALNLAPMELGSLTGVDASFSGLLSIAGRFLVPAGLSMCFAFYLLKGKRWARWICGLTAFCLAIDAGQYLVKFYPLLESAHGLQSMVQLGPLVLGRLPIVLGGIFVLYVLVLDRRSRDWFRFTHNAYREFRSEKQQRMPHI